ncbi:MAG TPA: diguanylate cyclase [Rhodobacterales bacterium]|nr:diguanylate cyclase [Rhodobacterales bacterium]
MPGRILIADPTATNRIILKVRLGAARYETIQASGGTEAMAEARAERPDLVILSAQLGDIGATDLCSRLKNDPLTRAIPVLIIGSDSNRADRLAGLRAGADDYLIKPVDEMTLLAIVRHLMRTRATYDEFARRRETNAALGFAEAGAGFDRPAKVALIAPSPETSLAWRRGLAPIGSFTLIGLTRSSALDTDTLGDAPDAFVIAADLHSPGDGLRLVSELRSHPATRYAVILIQNEADDIASVPLALDLGASAVVPGQFDGEEVQARLEALIARKRETDALRESLDQQLGLAVRDPLTGLFNRRYAEAYLTRIADEAARTGQPFAVMMLDLDRFKTVNDTFGHRVGDEVLIETARRLTDNLREIDLVARHGGEEFLVALPETGIAAARATAERLRRVIADMPMRSTSRAIDVPVTVSIGVSVCYGHDMATEMSVLIDQADTALYASKSEGRNLVTLSDQPAA